VSVKQISSNFSQPYTHSWLAVFSGDDEKDDLKRENKMIKSIFHTFVLDSPYKSEHKEGGQKSCKIK
jgi:hypothetical protein